MDENIIDTTDFSGHRVVFTRKKWKEKSSVHAELSNNTFMRNIKKAIENPHEIWQDKDDETNKVCCYWKYSVNTYVKVIIWISDDPRRVVSAFETNYIKETKYPKLRRLK